MNTHDNTEPKVEQWMREAVREIELSDCMTDRGAIIARHAPAQSPAKTPQASIWRPVSQRPTREDASNQGRVIWLYCGIEPFSGQWNSDICASGSTHWARPRDILAGLPLPVEQTQEELDAEWVGQLFRDCEPVGKNDVLDAIAYGRSTAPNTPDPTTP